MASKGKKAKKRKLKLKQRRAKYSPQIQALQQQMVELLQLPKVLEWLKQQDPNKLLEDPQNVYADHPIVRYFDANGLPGYNAEGGSRFLVSNLTIELNQWIEGFDEIELIGTKGKKHNKSDGPWLQFDYAQLKADKRKKSTNFVPLGTVGAWLQELLEYCDEPHTAGEILLFLSSFETPDTSEDPQA